MSTVRFINKITGEATDHLLWTFGDGTTSTSTDSTVFHNYAVSGDYTASLEGWSITDQYKKQTKIVIIPFSAEPDFGWDSSGDSSYIDYVYFLDTKEPVRFFNTTPGTVVSYDWTFGFNETIGGMYGAVSTPTSHYMIGLTSDTVDTPSRVIQYHNGNWSSTVIPTPCNWRPTIAYHDSLFVMAAWNKIYTSSNFLDWTLRLEIPAGDPTQGILNKMIWGNNEFFAVGTSDNSAYQGSLIARSLDGTTWNYTDGTDDYKGLYSLMWDGTNYYSLQESSTIIVRSSDGSDWSGVYDTGAYSIYVNSVYANGQYLYSINNNNVVYTSVDGYNWSFYTLDGSLGTFSGPLIYGDRFMTISATYDSTGTLFKSLYSFNGLDWTLGNTFFYLDVQYNFPNWNGLTWDGTTYAICGSTNWIGEGGVEYNLISLNGIDWTQAPPFAVTSSEENPVITFPELRDYTVNMTITMDDAQVHSVSKTINIITMNTGFSWDSTYGGHSEENPFGATKQPIVFSALDSSGDHYWNFGDGTTGTGASVAHSYAVPDIGSIVPYLVDHTVNLFGNYDSTSVILSIDNPFGTINRIIYSSGLGMFVGVGQYGYVITSSDGTTWTPKNLGGSDFNDIVDNGSMLVAVGDAGLIATSTDGSTWSLPSTDMSSADKLCSVIWDTTYSRFITTSYQGTSSFFTSEDGSVWTHDDGTQLPIATAQIIAYDGGYYAAGYRSSPSIAEFYYSTDLTSWTASPSSMSPPYINNVVRFNVVNGDLYACGGLSYFGSIVEIWKRTSLNVFDRLSVPSSLSGLVRDIAPTTGPGDYFCTYFNNKILRSSDASTWSVQNTNFDTTNSKILNSMCYHNGLFVAGTYYYPGAYVAQMYNSSDASSWTLVYG
jgi:hypothetical protein